MNIYCFSKCISLNFNRFEKEKITLDKPTIFIYFTVLPIFRMGLADFENNLSFGG